MTYPSDGVRLGCAIRTKNSGEETFVQLTTIGALFERKVLISMIGPTRDETIKSAMAAIGVAKLAEEEVAHPPPGQGAGLLVALVRCGMAVEGLAQCLSER